MKRTMNWLRSVLVSAVSGALAAAWPTVASAQRTVEGTSVQLKLDELVPPNAGVDKIQGLVRALDDLGTVTVDSLKTVRDARMAYESNPNGETEAGLFNANATVIRNQYEALGSVMNASRDASSALDKLRADSAAAGGAFAGQVGATEEARTRAREVVNRIEGQLLGLAERFDEIVGEDGQIKDEELEGAVIQAGVSRDYAEIVAQLADGDAQSAKADLKDLDEVAKRLRQQQGRLRVIAMRAQSQRTALATVAHSQIQRMQRRGVLLRAADFLKWANELNADGILDGKPVIALPAPGGSVLTDYGVPEVSGRSGADILRELRGKTAERPTNSSTNSESLQAGADKTAGSVKR